MTVDILIWAYPNAFDRIDRELLASHSYPGPCVNQLRPVL